MQQMHKRYINQSDGHNKFWEVYVIERPDGSATMRRRWGKIGTVGQESSEQFPTYRSAHQQAAKLVQQKREHGYIEDDPTDKRIEREAFNWDLHASCKCGHQRMLHKRLLHCGSHGCTCVGFVEGPKATLFHGTCYNPAPEHTSYHAERIDCVKWVRTEGATSPAKRKEKASANLGTVTPPSMKPPEPPKPQTLADLRARFRVKE
jgi:predicted DNA-binding WGR domain protein